MSPTKKRRTSRVVLTGMAVLVVGAGLLYNPWKLLESDEGAVAAAERTTTEVGPATIRPTFTAEGEAIYSPAGTVSAPAAGIITWLAAEGASVSTNQVLARVDDQPIVLLTGEEPAYRGLATGDEGSDVHQLESALVELGFDPDGTVSVDELFTANTAAMVMRWQEEVGLESTGSVSEQSVVFVPVDTVLVRTHVSEVGATVGAGTALFDITTTQRRFTFAVSATDRSTIETGDVVDVRYPDRSTIEATVTATSPAADGTSTVSAAISDPTAEPTAIDVIPVSISWTGDESVAAQTVPTGAILRLDSGDYVVERQLTDGQTEFVSVEVGEQLGSTIEIIGDIAVGDVVINP